MDTLIYAGAYAALRFDSDKNFDQGIGSCLIFATNRKEASEILMKRCKTEFPIDEGWTDHDIHITGNSTELIWESA
jgi:hypothetical protein